MKFEGILGLLDKSEGLRVEVKDSNAKAKFIVYTYKDTEEFYSSSTTERLLNKQVLGISITAGTLTIVLSENDI